MDARHLDMKVLLDRWMVWLDAWGGWNLSIYMGALFNFLASVQGGGCCVECGHRWGWVVSNADTVGLGLPREKNREEVYIIRDIISLFLRKD